MAAAQQTTRSAAALCPGATGMSHLLVLLCALVLRAVASLGSRSTLLANIYLRGSHWAMGKCARDRLNGCRVWVPSWALWCWGGMAGRQESGLASFSAREAARYQHAASQCSRAPAWGLAEVLMQCVS